MGTSNQSAVSSCKEGIRGCFACRVNLPKSFDEVPQLYIDPTECIDCGACVPVCPVTGIFAQEDLPEKWHAYLETNRNYVDGGKFQRDKYQKASS